MCPCLYMFRDFFVLFVCLSVFCVVLLLVLVCVCVCKPVDNSGCHPQEHCPHSLRQGLSLVQSSIIRLDGLASEPQGFSWLHLPKARLKRCGPTWHIYKNSGDWPLVLMLALSLTLEGTAVNMNPYLLIQCCDVHCLGVFPIYLPISI